MYELQFLYLNLHSLPDLSMLSFYNSKNLQYAEIWVIWQHLEWRFRKFAVRAKKWWGISSIQIYFLGILTIGQAHTQSAVKTELCTSGHCYCETRKIVV